MKPGESFFRLVLVAVCLTSGVAPARAYDSFCGLKGPDDAVVGSSACATTAKNTPIYKALTACRAEQAAANAVDLMKNSHLAGGQTGFCQMGTQTFSSTAVSDEFCKDPNGFVCSRSGGTGAILTSSCRMDLEDAKEAQNTPGSVFAKCQVKEKQAVIIAKYKGTECAGISDPTTCDAKILGNKAHENEFFKAERDAIYTPERIAAMTKLFERVKAKYIELLDKSTVSDASSREYLKNRIKRTNLALDEKSLADPRHRACQNSKADQLETAFYNADSPPDGLNHEFHICAGAMANLEMLDPYNQMMVIGHELSHSIDPCAVESDAWWRLNASQTDPKKRGAPNLGSRVLYPHLVECLRGGDSKNGCEGSGAVLNCTTKEGRHEKCTEYANNNKTPGETMSWSELYNECNDEAVNTPSCRHGAVDKTQSKLDVGDYRKNGAPLEQIGESFADFMGAEVSGEIMKDDSNPAATECPGPADLNARRDGAIATASMMARLHGVCKTDKTLDEHPTGFYRMNRMVMGSARFRQAVGCGTTTPKGGTACKGF